MSQRPIAGNLHPGGPAPATSDLAAMTIAVDDVAAARAIVDSAGIDTRGTFDGFFVSARDAYGFGLFFSPAAG
ncbi:hypothetical protein ACQPW1_31445 [Nocardia sp. CA-128927]|uniref:hypothetical protein n=1 Tax=Nocardia sp. CA-128927 TaxID=3239975 RepID=UPI003D959C82